MIPPVPGTGDPKVTAVDSVGAAPVLQFVIVDQFASVAPVHVAWAIARDEMPRTAKSSSV
jgi:hypothetical protein